MMFALLQYEICDGICHENPLYIPCMKQVLEAYLAA